MAGADAVVINDVGPRDGLQNQPQVLEPTQRLELIRALVAAGLRHIEFGAFVSPRAVPAMAGSEQIAAQLPNDGVRYTALIPNARGYELAKAAGVRSMALVLAASSTMNEKNIRMDTAAALAVCREVLAQARRDRVSVQVYVATAWECPFEGPTPPARVIDLCDGLQAAGAAQLVIADTIGAAHPRQVAALMQALVETLGAGSLACHFHDTRALGLANVYAAYEVGIRHFDASVGGLGGCPFAPGASGNVATEDLVMLFEMMGVATGIDLPKLLDAAMLAAHLTGRPTGGRAQAWLARNLDRFSAAAA